MILTTLQSGCCRCRCPRLACVFRCGPTIVGLVAILLLLLARGCHGLPVSANSSDEDESVSHRSGGDGVAVAGWNPEHTKGPLVYAFVLFLVAISKIAYHHAGFLSSKIPESCILIALGIGAGMVIVALDPSDSLPMFFKPHEFFMYLLPPIILEASYCLHNRAFGENMGSILLLAVLGTVLAAASVGLSLFYLIKAGAMGSIEDLDFVGLMVFASLIVAVDPVAVLAVFQEIGVNQNLYFLVFGESLLNDGVTVVLYNVFMAYNEMDEIAGVHIVLGVIKFFAVCLGGLTIGILSGLLSALLTKVTQHVQVTQPLILYSLAYLGYLLAESFEFSGIISIIGCGLTQRRYAFPNLSESASSTIKSLTNVASTACEVIIFLFLGLSVAQADHEAHAAFITWTIVLCLVYRFVIVFGMTSLINWFDTRSVRKIGYQEQFIIAYGGLRGAVCFSLVKILDSEAYPLKQMFVTTTLALIIFTVFVQGTTVKPLVYLLKIRLAPEKTQPLNAEFHNTVTNHMMTGIEGIVGDHGRSRIREKLVYFNENYLEPILTRPRPGLEQFRQLHDHLLLREHVRYLKLSGAKSIQSTPQLPRVPTENILAATGMQIGCHGDHESFTPYSAYSSYTFSGVDRKRSRDAEMDQSNHSVQEAPDTKTAKRETAKVDARRLWGLLRSKTRCNFALAYRDRNLADPDSMGTEIQSKVLRNRRLQQIIEKWADPESRKNRLRPPSIAAIPSTQDMWKTIALAAMLSSTTTTQPAFNPSYGGFDSNHELPEDNRLDGIWVKASAPGNMNTNAISSDHCADGENSKADSEVASRETIKGEEEKPCASSKSKNGGDVVSVMLSRWRNRGHSEGGSENTHL